MTALCKFEGRTEERELSFEYGDLIKITKIINKVILFKNNCNKILIAKLFLRTLSGLSESLEANKVIFY